MGQDENGDSRIPKRPCPKSHREVRSRDDKQVWISAEKAHIDKCADIGVWELVPPTYAGITNVMGSTWAYSHNPSPMDPTVDLLKARVAVQGFTQWHGVDYKDTASPTLQKSTYLTMESVAVHIGWTRKPGRTPSADVNSAFYCGYSKFQQYMKQPPGWEVQADHEYAGHQGWELQLLHGSGQDDE